jgi:hypothetical protein
MTGKTRTFEFDFNLLANQFGLTLYPLMEVLDTWIDPCYVELFATNSSGNITTNFNSGTFNVNSVKAATPTT